MSTLLMQPVSMSARVPPDVVDYFADLSESDLTLPINVSAFDATMASYRRWAIDGELRWQALDTVNITDDDRALAMAMKEHFRNKIFVDGLKGKIPSKFNTDLYELLLNKTTVKQKHIGMLYKLPYLYFEDLGRAALWKELGNYPDLSFNPVDLIEQKLVPIKTILRSRRNREVNEFWYVNEVGQPVCWISHTNSPVHSLVECISRWSHVVVSSKFVINEDRRAGRKYWVVVNPTLSNLHQDATCYMS